MKVGVAIIIASLILMSVSSQLQRDYYHWICIENVDRIVCNMYKVALADLI